MLNNKLTENAFFRQLEFALIVLFISLGCEFIFVSVMSSGSPNLGISGFFSAMILSALLGLYAFQSSPSFISKIPISIKWRVLLYLEILIIFFGSYYILRNILKYGKYLWENNGDYPVIIFIFMSILSFFINFSKLRREISS